MEKLCAAAVGLGPTGGAVQGELAAVLNTAAASLPPASTGAAAPRLNN